jgi:linearmycin/streptolysin S transport system ATP-binding protein
MALLTPPAAADGAAPDGATPGAKRAAPPSAPVLRCTDLAKRYGDRQAVDGVGFEIGRGETYGLLGPNGAGKTTTISMVAGLLEADAGSVLLEGEALTPTATSLKGRIGLVPQELAIYPDLSARENLTFFARLYGLSGRELRARVDELLEVIDLADRSRERTDRFSGGMKRRLNIAIGLLARPTLLILDEPTVGVDPQSRNAILTSIEALSDEGMAVLYTTHYMEEAERLCDRVGIIDEGRIRAEGTRRELVALLGAKDHVSMAGGGDLAAATDALRAFDRVADATPREGGLDLVVTEARTLLPALLAAAADAGMVVRSVEVVEPDLEAVFLHLTGKALRD